jgi:glycosyltransferase involved in cell wall biosynthesis
MLRLLVLVAKPLGTAPAQRFRLEQWARHLSAQHRIELSFRVYESPELTEALYAPGKLRKAYWLAHDTVRRARTLAEARAFDGVVVHREASTLGPAIYERAFSRMGVPLIYDFDDAIWLQGAGSVNGVFSRLRFAGKTGTLCALASAVSAGSPHLARYAEARSSRVFVVPTSIELADYPVAPPLTTDDPFVIGWSGSFSTLIHLERARAPIERLARRRKVVVRVVCNKAPERPFVGAETIYVPWQEAGEAEELGRVHVGIMPLPDDEFARGKCGLKALQYMATGRPVVLSPVGVNVEIVRHGDNGFLADDDDAWMNALDRLASNRAEREAVGRAARETVERGYAAEHSAAKFAEVVRAAISAR